MNCSQLIEASSSDSEVKLEDELESELEEAVDQKLNEENDIKDDKDTQAAISQLLGESPAAPGECEQLPMRSITNFELFTVNEDQEKQLVSPFEIERANGVYARGLVMAISADDEDEDAENEVDGGGPPSLVFVTSVIFHTEWSDKPGIFIRTQYAWYRLDIPAEHYVEVFEPDWVAQYLLSLVCSIISSGDDSDLPPESDSITTIEDLEDLLLGETCSRATMGVIGRQLTVDDIHQHVRLKYLLSLDELANFFTVIVFVAVTGDQSYQGEI